MIKWYFAKAKDNRKLLYVLPKAMVLIFVSGMWVLLDTCSRLEDVFEMNIKLGNHFHYIAKLIWLLSYKFIWNKPDKGVMHFEGMNNHLM